MTLADVIAEAVRDADGDHAMSAGSLGEVVADLFEQVGWIDELGQLWSLGLRTGDVPTDRPLYAFTAR